MENKYDILSQSEDVDKLKTRIRQLEEENKELLRALEEATEKFPNKGDWRIKGW